MGLIAELIEWFRTSDGDAQIAEARGNPGGDDVVTAPDFQPSGYDAQPLPGDYMLLVPGPEKGSWVIAGWVDPNNAGRSRPGDVRLYVRDSGGAVQGELHLTSDGEEPDWAATAGALIARADRTDAALNALATVFNSHQHPYTGGGTSSGPLVSGPPASGNPATTETVQAQETDHNVGADKGWVT